MRNVIVNNKLVTLTDEQVDDILNFAAVVCLLGRTDCPYPEMDTAIAELNQAMVDTGALPEESE